jgi:hypothetical protein
MENRKPQGDAVAPAGEARFIVERQLRDRVGNGGRSVEQMIDVLRDGVHARFAQLFLSKHGIKPLSPALLSSIARRIEGRLGSGALRLVAV